MSGKRNFLLAIGLIVVVAVVQGLMLFAFAWPGVNSGPRELPVAVAGPPDAVGPIASGLEGVDGAEEGTPAFDVVEVADEAAAEQAIWDREVYGAVVATPDGSRLLVASGAGPAVAQLLRTGVSELAAAGGGTPPEVVDVVPAYSGDPNGSGLAAGVLPVVMTSAAAGLAIGIFLTGVWVRIFAVIGLAAGGGALSGWLLMEPLNALPGPYLGLSGTLALVIAAVSAGVAGLGALLGRVGAGLGMLATLFVGNPLSAATSAPELLPFGEYGQYLPPGAGVSLVRSISFFDGAAVTDPLLVLGAWIAGGLVLVIVGGLLRRGRTDRAEGAEPDRSGPPETSEPAVLGEPTPSESADESRARGESAEPAESR